MAIKIIIIIIIIIIITIMIIIMTHFVNCVNYISVKVENDPNNFCLWFSRK